MVDLPTGRKPITGKWVYKLKIKEGNIDRYKARYVARGFSQKEELDYNETFSPVTRLESIRILLVLTNHSNWRITQMDVKTAFLYGALKEEIYMIQPKGFEKGTKVCKLEKSIYGLKQASKNWNECVSAFLKIFHLSPLKSDSCIFVNDEMNIKGNMLILCIYVDDGLIVGNCSKTMNKCIDYMKTKFEITTNEPNMFVGIKIKRDKNNNIMMNQTDYINRMLMRFG